MNILRNICMLTTAATLVCAIFTGCADKNAVEHDKLDDVSAADDSSTTLKDTASTEEVTEHPRAQFDITIGGEEAGSFVITLYPEYAPITCENFEELVNDGFYDGLTFHRVVDDFMAQGGDPNGDGTGGNSTLIKGEFSENGVDNTLSHTRGIVSMARSSDYDSASSQFFICYTDCSFLDGSYAAFGEVTEGMEVVDSFLEVERTENAGGETAVPVQTIEISSARMIDPEPIDSEDDTEDTESVEETESTETTETADSNDTESAEE